MKKALSLFFFLFSLAVFSQLKPEFIQLKPPYKYHIQFDFTGAVQTWTVPAGVNVIFVDVAAAQGGNYTTIMGGKGGKISCRMLVTPGTVFYITVGGQSSNQTAVFGYGGNGGTGTSAIKNAMAGGGLSAFATANPLTQANALLIAGGGGGATGKIGGYGGGTLGADGVGTYNSVLRGGKGGTQLAGGAAGTVLDANSVLPTNGAVLNGGRGGSVTAASTWTGGGGGGAGYYGGGGGAGGGNAIGGGGGGSSWSHTSCLQVSNIANFRTGHGRVVIYYN